MVKKQQVGPTMGSKSKSALVNKLDKATTRAVEIVVKKAYPLKLSNKFTLVGKTFIEKNNLGLYNVLNQDKQYVIKDISMFDIAVIIAQKYNIGEQSTVKRIIDLEEKYTKYYIDMLHYLNCLKSARKKDDFERMFILEDKFQTAEMLAKDIKNNILNFKRIK